MEEPVFVPALSHMIFRKEFKMLTLVFGVLMFLVFGKLLLLALKLSWGILRIFVTIIFLPLTIIFTFACGLIHLAFLLLILAGIFSLFDRLF